MKSEDLPQHVCASLLRSGVTGRVAVCTPDGPHLIPVNHSVVDESVVIRTDPNSRLATYGPGSILAFEVDQMDYEEQSGWSVLVRGRAHQVTDLRELEHVLAMWSPQPWADGDRNYFLKFAWSEISGRCLGSEDDIRDMSSALGASARG